MKFIAFLVGFLVENLTNDLDDIAPKRSPERGALLKVPGLGVLEWSYTCNWGPKALNP